MSLYAFLVRGNQTDLCGNPIPYERVLKQHMRARSVRYHLWQQYVRACFYDYCSRNNMKFSFNKKPIVIQKGQKARMDIVIGWAKGMHGDEDNIWKGIADSLFENDVDIDGSFAAAVSDGAFSKVPAGNGFVHITIEISDARHDIVSPHAELQERCARASGTDTRLQTEAG